MIIVASKHSAIRAYHISVTKVWTLPFNGIVEMCIRADVTVCSYQLYDKGVDW